MPSFRLTVWFGFAYAARVRRMGIVGGLWLLMATSGSAQDVAPDDGYDREARGLFIAGQAAYDRAEYATALTHFERAYELSRRPELLFNIGLAAQRASEHERARGAFRAYLSERPDAPNRPDVEARLEEVELALRSETAQVSESTELAGTGAGDGPGVVSWLAIGGGAAVAIGGVVLFAMAQSDVAAVEDAPVDSDWAEVRDAYDRAPLLSGIGIALIGVGVAGAALGLVLIVGDGSSEAQVAFGPGSASVRGRF